MLSLWIAIFALHTGGNLVFHTTRTGSDIAAETQSGDLPIALLIKSGFPRDEGQQLFGLAIFEIRNSPSRHLGEIDSMNFKFHVAAISGAVVSCDYFLSECRAY